METPWIQTKEEIIKAIVSALKKLKYSVKEADLENCMEEPPNSELGDLACNIAFHLAKKLKKNPNTLAEEINSKLHLPKIVSEVKIASGYINFFLDKGKFGELVLSAEPEKAKAVKEVAIVEFPAPNTNKPLHLGHLRNLALGESVSRLLENQGYKVHRVNLNNDRGIHVCKSMLAYDKWGNKKEPAKKPDHFVGDFYVMFNKKVEERPELEDEAREMLRKWENGDNVILELWEKMSAWAIKGFEETYEKFGAKKFDKTYYESETYKKGKEVVEEGLKKGIFYKDETGAVMVDLEEHGLGKKVLLRADGTAVYITQDLYLTEQRYKDFSMDKAIWVVGSEQIHHFQVLFKIFELLNKPFTKGCYHLAYGMVYLPEGRMKSREGRVVDADDLIEELESLAAKEVKKRNEKLSEKEIRNIGEKIGLGAIKFFLLKYNPKKDFLFDPDKSISFEGETGPYVQYAAVRAKRILEKSKYKESKKVKFDLLKLKEEFRLVKQLAKFESIIEEAAKHYSPNLVANYVFDLADCFNSFYTVAPVIKAEKANLKKARLALVSASYKTICACLDLLGIEVPERM